MLDPRFAAAALSAPPITFMAVLTRNAAPVRSEAALLGAAAKDAVLPTVPHYRCTPHHLLYQHSDLCNENPMKKLPNE